MKGKANMGEITAELRKSIGHEIDDLIDELAKYWGIYSEGRIRTGLYKHLIGL